MGEIIDIPNGWQSSALKEIATINPKLPFDNIPDDMEVSFLPMKLVEAEMNIIHLSESKRYSEVRKGFTPMTDGDVIFAKITPCMENGKIAVVHSLRNKVGFGSTEFHVLRCNGAITNSYLFYFLVQSRVRQDAQHNMTGAVGQRRVPKKYLEDLKLPLPPQPEQHRIVESLKTAQQQLKVYRQAVLKWAFEGKLTNENVVDGELPKEWRWKRIKDITSVLGDGLHGTPIYSENGDHFFINGNNLSDGKIQVKGNTKRVAFEEYEKYEKPLNERTIFVSINGTLGNTAFYNNEKVILGKSACYFNVLDAIDKHYIRYCITSYRFIHYANKNATGSTIQNVGLKAMREYEVPIPPTFHEQQLIVAEIESRLSVCDKIEETIEQSLRQAESLRQSILKKAFEGKLVPQDPNDEPASVLLARIKAEREQNKPENPPRRQTIKTRTKKAKS
jgi:type I restriction enzyme S subunit